MFFLAPVKAFVASIYFVCTLFSYFFVLLFVYIFCPFDFFYFNSGFLYVPLFPALCVCVCVCVCVLIYYIAEVIQYLNNISYNIVILSSLILQAAISSHYFY